jgi:chaperonin cofactor prefoldin
VTRLDDSWIKKKIDKILDKKNKEIKEIEKIENDRAKYTITGNGVVHVDASDILNLPAVQAQLKIPVKK